MLRFNKQKAGINWGLEIFLKFNKPPAWGGGGGGALKNDNY